MVRKDVKEIKEVVSKLSTSMSIKAMEYDKIKDFLKDIKIEVAKCNTLFDESRMEYIVKVEYKMPTITLTFDEDGDVMLNERFRAINSLDLISMDDMDRIADSIQRAKNLNKEVGRNV